MSVVEGTTAGSLHCACHLASFYKSHRCRYLHAYNSNNWTAPSHKLQELQSQQNCLVGWLGTYVFSNAICSTRLPTSMQYIESFLQVPLHAVLQEQFAANPDFVYSEQITQEQSLALLKVRTNIYVFVQGLPGCFPWGVLLTYLTDFLAQNKGMTVERATVVRSQLCHYNAIWYMHVQVSCYFTCASISSSSYVAWDSVSACVRLYHRDR